MEDQNSYSKLRTELEDIVIQVRSKDVPLERCLDLFDDALKIGGRCVEQIDRTDFTAEELDAAMSEGRADGDGDIDDNAAEDAMADGGDAAMPAAQAAFDAAPGAQGLGDEAEQPADAAMDDESL
jgi:exonuclease VII small subunit